MAVTADPPRDRLLWIDALRGAAVLAMIGYHLAWDLTFFGLTGFRLLDDAFWYWQPRLITGTFLTLVGISVTLATARRRVPPRYLRRTGWIALAALAITGATYIGFPDSFIFFGILHCVAAASLIGLALARLPWPVLGTLAVAVFALSAVDFPPALDHPWLIWLGLGDRVPATNDFVPLIPWAGFTLAGMALARGLLVGSTAMSPAGHPESGAIAGALTWLGRNALLIYLIHQPVLLGILFALHYAVGLGRPDIMNVF